MDYQNTFLFVCAVLGVLGLMFSNRTPEEKVPDFKPYIPVGQRVYGDEESDLERARRR